MAITDTPKLNKDIVSGFETAKQWANDRLAKLMEKQPAVNTFPLYALFLTVLFACIALWYLYRSFMLLETPTNIHRITNDSIKAQNRYSQANPSRVGIREYLANLKRAGVPDTQLVLTNFYVSTVNAGGLFFPITDGVASGEAARAAILGGARGIVFDIWPDLSPGANFGPILQIVESGSQWRRISMNSIPLQYALKPLIEEAFEHDGRPGFYDPLILYLRFRGNPRTSTYNLTARALSATLESYRLPYSYNACRGQDMLFSTLITDLFRKVIIVSNTKAEGSSLRDYINVGPKAGVKLEYTINEARSLTQDGKAQQIGIIRQNLTWVAPFSEDANAESNSWDIQPSLDVGIMFCAMNFWNNNDRLKKYMGSDMFGKQSFAIKPLPLRLTLDVLPVSSIPVDPKWGTDNAKKGAPAEVASIQLPN